MVRDARYETMAQCFRERGTRGLPAVLARWHSGALQNQHLRQSKEIGAAGL